MHRALCRGSSAPAPLTLAERVRAARLIAAAGACLVVCAAACGGGPVDPADSPVALSDCEARTRSLRAEYAALRLCSSDDECVYVDGFYEIIPRAQRDALVTDFDCKEPSPFLVTANGALLAPRLASLAAEREAQRESCGDLPEPRCSNVGGFTSTLPPTCVSGACVEQVAGP